VNSQLWAVAAGLGETDRLNVRTSIADTELQSTRRLAVPGHTWSSHDLDRALRMYTDDVIYEDVPLGSSTGVRTASSLNQVFCARVRNWVRDEVRVWPR
jgi:hypothetical protein